MPTYTDGWARNGLVHIHYIDKAASCAAGAVPLVVSPGVWEPAERALPLCGRMTRRAVAVSYRGRGRSDTPATGYDLEDHVGDLAAAVEAAGLDRFALLAFSRGVGPALAYALGRLHRVAGLVIVDHPPIHFAWARGTAAVWKQRVYLGRPFTDFMRTAAFDGIEREARQVEFWEDLRRLTCPVLLLQGRAAGRAIPPEISEADATRYRALVPDLRVVGFEESGHMIPDEEPDKYLLVVEDFLAELDRGAASSPAPDRRHLASTT